MSNEQEMFLKKNKWKNKQYCVVSAAPKEKKLTQSKA